MDAAALDHAAPAETGRLVFKALSRWSMAILLLFLLLFLSAGTFAYWQAWVYVAILGLSSLLFIVYYLRVDPGLIAGRMKVREKEREQQRIQQFSLMLFVAAFVVPGLDRRYGWSVVPVGAVLAADVMILLGYVVFTRVMRENRYASRVIEIQQGQRVISTGPYAIVRHPMYVAVLMIFVIGPVALGSWWGIAASVWLVPMLVARIRNEETVLRRELPEYSEYVKQTRYRLIPSLW
jgi:protein-S-isoprenylcysteine O-methyltransferase Ste14